MKKLFVLLIAAILCLGFALPGAAQDTSPVAVAQAGGGAVVTGLSGLYDNPAAVHFANLGRFSLEFGGYGTAWNNLLYNDYISDSAKSNILSKISNTGWVAGGAGSGGMKFRVGPIRNFKGSVSVFTGMKADGLVRVSPDIASLVLEGNQIGEQYDLAGTDGGGAVFLDTGASLSFDLTERVRTRLGEELTFRGEPFELQNFNLGLTYRYMRGAIFNYEATGTGILEYDETGEPVLSGNISSNFKFHDPGRYAASGSAIDVGVFGHFNDDYSLGFAIQNLIGRLTVPGGEQVRYEDEIEIDDLTNLGEESFSDAVTEELTDGFSYRLPLTIRLAGSYSWRDWLQFNSEVVRVGYVQVSDYRISFGMENSYFSKIPLRAGINYSTLRNNIAVNAGLGWQLGPWRTDLAISDLTGIFNRSRGMTAAVTTGFEF